MTETKDTPAIDVNNLTYVFQDGTVGIHPTSFQLPRGSRTLLIGANGAGKSTLLRVLSGKTLAKQGAVHIYGKDPFRDGSTAGGLALTYLGTEWAANPIVRYDLSVVELLESMGGGETGLYAARRRELVDILDIDLRWRMHQASDGERRRVQLAMGLLRPWTTLLLDEVTVDLDVLVRARLLEFLRRETQQRDCAIVYATHIFDGLGEWPTHAVHMHMGTITHFGEYVVELEVNQKAQGQRIITVAGEKLDSFETNRVVKRVRGENGELVSSQVIEPHRVAAGSADLSGGLLGDAGASNDDLVIPKNSVLLELALQWLRRDLQERGERGERIKWSEIRDKIMSVPR